MSYLHSIFRRSTDGGVQVTLIRADSVTEAAKGVLKLQHPGLQILPNGAISIPWKGISIEFEHPIAAIEGLYKRSGDWEIRRVPTEVLVARPGHLLSGPRAGDISSYATACVEALALDWKSDRLQSFLWYLDAGPMVTFYRPNGGPRLDLVGRYVLPRGVYGPCDKWNGGYDSLATQLWLGYDV